MDEFDAQQIAELRAKWQREGKPPRSEFTLYRVENGKVRKFTARVRLGIAYTGDYRSKRTYGLVGTDCFESPEPAAAIAAQQLREMISAKQAELDDLEKQLAKVEKKAGKPAVIGG